MEQLLSVQNLLLFSLVGLLSWRQIQAQCKHKLYVLHTYSECLQRRYNYVCSACVCVCNASIHHFLTKSAVEQCSVLPEPANAMVTYTEDPNPNYPTNTVAIFICTSGYILVDSRSLFRVCFNGVWSGPPAVCFCELSNLRLPYTIAGSCVFAPIPRLC